MADLSGRAATYEVINSARDNGSKKVSVQFYGWPLNKGGEVKSVKMQLVARSNEVNASLVCPPAIQINDISKRGKR